MLFGGYHTAERFSDDDRLTAHFPGPGSYVLGSTCTSPAEGSTKYARPLVEDGVIKPDGSAIGFRERDSWIRGTEGPKVDIRELRGIVCHTRGVSTCDNYFLLLEASVHSSYHVLSIDARMSASSFCAWRDKLSTREHNEALISHMALFRELLLCQQGLTSLSVGNTFVCPATYSTEPCERAIKETVSTALKPRLRAHLIFRVKNCPQPEEVS